MKIRVVSDLHIDFSPIEIPSGDILIVAGDLCEIRHKSTLHNFYESHSPKFNHIIAVCGNHEFYGGEITTDVKKYKSLVKDFQNVYILDNESITINNTLFLGSVLWSDFNKRNEMCMFDSGRGMNDFRVIRKNYSKLKPIDVLRSFDKNVQWIKKELEENNTKDIVVITHHAPSLQSIHEKYKNDTINGAYCSDLEEIMFYNPNIKFWFHGHTHSSFNYKVNETKVVCNPRGYGFENDYDFSTEIEFDIS